MYYSLFLIGFILVIIAQTTISSRYNKYKKIKLNQNLTGQEIARKILDANGLENVYVVETKGDLTDHYDPRRKVIRLSSSIYKDESIASAAVAAHEVGHAIQDKEGYSFYKLRSTLVPVVNFVTYLGYFGLLISIFAGITGYIKISLVVILATLLFQLITLPVEFDASRKAKKQLVDLGLIEKGELLGVDSVLKAAAFTYIASFISTLLQFARIALMFRGRDD